MAGSVAQVVDCLPSKQVWDSEFKSQYCQNKIYHHHQKQPPIHTKKEQNKKIPPQNKQKAKLI
jgi:hypothetical protein